MTLHESEIPWGTAPTTTTERGHRTIRLTPASSIRPRPVRWLWRAWMALGTLVLLAGREGIGKSILGYTFAAQITRGALDGVFAGTPRAVMVAASEDSWESTIVPRLMAAGADLDRVFRVDVTTTNLDQTELSLPRDLPQLERAVIDSEAALIMLDPLMSRLDEALDTHKDVEVRRALEPLVTLADRTGATVLALIHVNKSGSSDPLTTIMGSRAFAAVARSVLFVMTDPDDEKIRLLGCPKNNLGRSDLPTMSFSIVEEMATNTIEGPIWTGKLQWGAESDRTIREALEAAGETSGDKSATSEAKDWLQDYLTQNDGRADSADVRRDGAKAGHSKNALFRAKDKLGIASITSGFPRRAFWLLPASQYSQSPGETSTNGTNGNSGNTDDQYSQRSQYSQCSGAPQSAGNTVAGPDGQPFTFDPSKAVSQ